MFRLIDLRPGVTIAHLIRRPPPSPHKPRRLRDCLGELTQIDGSEQAWFEIRGEPCTVLAFVDDTTSRLMQLRF